MCIYADVDEVSWWAPAEFGLKMSVGWCWCLVFPWQTLCSTAGSDDPMEILWVWRMEADWGPEYRPWKPRTSLPGRILPSRSDAIAAHRVVLSWAPWLGRRWHSLPPAGEGDLLDLSLNDCQLLCGWYPEEKSKKKVFHTCEINCIPRSVTVSPGNA